MNNSNHSFRGATRVAGVGVLSVVALALTAGCSGAAGGENAPSDEAVTETHEALEGLFYFTWQGTLNNLADAFTNGSSLNLDLTVGNGYTCWVAGVRGNLEQTGAVSILKNEGSPSIPTVPFGHWMLSIGGLPGASVSGSAVCAPVTDLGTFQFFPTQQGAFTSANVLTNVNVNSWCGLGEVYSNSLPPYVWTSGSKSFATVSDNGLNAEPKVGGPTWTFSEQNANASATCASIPAGQAVKGVWFYHIVAPASGTASFAMLQNNGQQLPLGAVCFLTSVEGSFTDNSFSDGIAVSTNFATHAWTMTASNGKSGWALCID
jgi:hypothetical protein